DLGRDGPVGSLDADGDGNAPAFVTRVPLSSFNSIVLDAGGGDDTLILDLSGGNFIPAGGVDAQGGEGMDKLMVEGATTRTATANGFSIPGAGTVTLEDIDQQDLDVPAAPILDAYFHSFLGRGPSAAEVSDTRQRLQAGLSLKELAGQFVISP